jgi:hypothetical protein
MFNELKWRRVVRYCLIGIGAFVFTCAYAHSLHKEIKTLKADNARLTRELDACIGVAH